MYYSLEEHLRVLFVRGALARQCAPYEASGVKQDHRGVGVDAHACSGVARRTEFSGACCRFAASRLGGLVAVEDMSHEPMGSLRETFRGAQVRWATVDKEGYAIVSTSRRLEYLLWGDVHIFTDHGNLAYIFNPEACVTFVSETAAQRLEKWKAVLG